MCQIHIGSLPSSPVPSFDWDAKNNLLACQEHVPACQLCPEWQLTLHFMLLPTKQDLMLKFEVNPREHLATPASPSAWPQGQGQTFC